jgi:hypothetical protein
MEGDIKANLPPILEALRALGFGDKPMVLMAIATIRAETAGFEPISEFKSRFNTSPRGIRSTFTIRVRISAIAALRTERISRVVASCN